MRHRCRQPVSAHKQNLLELRKRSGVSASLREMDRYLWLAGQYREWLKRGDDARINGELRGLFEAPPSDTAREDLKALVRDGA